MLKTRKRAKLGLVELFTAILAVAIMAISPALAQEKQAKRATNGSTMSSTETDGQSQGDQPSGVEGEFPAEAPDLADIIPLATKLSGRFVALENRVTGLVDVSAVERRYAEIEADLKEPADEIASVKESGDYRHTYLVKLRKEIRQKNELLEEVGMPLRQAIGQLGTWRKEWMAEKKHWKEWQSALLVDGKPVRLKSTFQKANHTIDRALELVGRQLEAMLAVQEKTANVNARINSLAAEVDNMTMDIQLDVTHRESPPMYSSRYFSQFRRGLWHAVRRGVDEISWPGGRFFARQGWTILIHGFLSLCLIIAFYRNRRVIKESRGWQFLAARPISAGLFFGGLTASIMYAYEGVPDIWNLANSIVVVISYVRLTGGLIDVSWKRRFVYGFLTVYIITKLMVLISFPLPLFRLYTVLTALVGLLFCMRWVGESSLHKTTGLYTWLLRICSLFFAVIIIAELVGKNELAFYLFNSLITTIVTLCVFLLFMYMIRGGLDWLFRTSPLQRAAVFHSDDTDAIIRRVARFADIALLGLVLLPANLMIWGVYDTLEGATYGVLALGFNLGSQRITVGLLIVSAGILYGSFFVSLILQKLLTDEVLAKSRVEQGVRLSIARLVHYVIIFVGFLFALFVLGFKITELTIILSALGVGIGFGLQAIVNNFVSGLILLFERPVRVGDTIEIGGNWAEIKKIGLRATTVQTFDQADLIVPNADLVTSQVTNWTLSNRQVRLTIPVGVAYGSDVSLVMETLKACADANSKVVKTPKSQVLFLGFGESSLDFELRVFVRDANDRIQVKSELHQEIDRSFRKAKIEISFPQRDLHLRSMDDSIILRPPDPAK